MPIERERVLGAELPEHVSHWGPDDLLLYHLALGAGEPPTDPGELEYTYERHLKALPSYGVLPALPLVMGMLEVPGMNVDLTKILHGEQDLELHEPLPVSAEVRTNGRVTGVYDKGRAALVRLEATTVAADDGRPLVTNRFGAIVRGEGSFGGPPDAEPDEEMPKREPDRILHRTTLPQQGLLYRLCGDRNPLHVDPESARWSGFERPILHGLCSYGITCKAVVDGVLDGAVARVRRYRARFAGIVMPGETLEIAIWVERSRAVVAVRCVERDQPVLSNTAVWFD